MPGTDPLLFADPQSSIEAMIKLAVCPGVTADRAKLTAYSELFHDGLGIRRTADLLGDDIYQWILGFSQS